MTILVLGAVPTFQVVLFWISFLVVGAVFWGGTAATLRGAGCPPRNAFLFGACLGPLGVILAVRGGDPKPLAPAGGHVLLHAGPADHELMPPAPPSGGGLL